MKSKDKKEKQTAVEYLKSFDETLNIMESIGDTTSKEQEVLIESSSKKDYLDEEGVFKMESLMDVDISSNLERNVPRVYTEPVEELDDTDKSLITDEFVNMVKNWQNEVIDFSDIGPVATVIQNKLGYRQDIEGFLNELINTAVEKQDSQSFAHGDKPVPGMKGKPVEDGGPTDVAPETVSPTDSAQPMEEMPVGGEMAPEMGMEEVPPMGGEVAPEMGMEEVPPMGGEVAPEMGMEEVPPMDTEVAPDMEEVPPMDTEAVPELAGEEAAPELGGEEAVPELAGEEAAPVPELDGEEAAPAPELGGEEAAPEEKAVEGEEKEEKKEEDDEDDIDIQLEAIKTEYTEKVKEKKIDAQLESIKNDLLKSVEAKVEATEPKVEEPKVEAKVEATEPKAEEPKVEAEEKTDPTAAKLEAIANDYHAKENAKIEAANKEKELDARLESIAAGYHAGEKAKVEAVEKEKKLDTVLESLAADYHKSEKTAKVENAEARKEAKEKIDKIAGKK